MAHEVAEDEGDHYYTEGAVEDDAADAVEFAAEFGAHQLVDHGEGVEGEGDTADRGRQEGGVVGVSSTEAYFVGRGK